MDIVVSVTASDKIYTTEGLSNTLTLKDGESALLIAADSTTYDVSSYYSDAKKPANVVVVNSINDLIVPPETRIKIKAGFEYQFGNIDKISSPYEMDIEEGSVIQGPTQFKDAYEYTGTGVAFNTPDGVSWEMRDFGYSVPNGSVFDSVGSGVFFSSSSRCYICDKVGTFAGSGVATVAFSNSVFVNIKTSGLRLTGAFTQLSMRANFMIASSPLKIIDWTGATFENMEILNLEPRGPVGTESISGDGDSNILGTAVAAIRDSNLDFGGITPLGGTLTPDDAGYSYTSSGVLNSKLVGHCYVTTPQTTNITAGVEVIIAGIFTEGSATSQTTCAPNGIITTLNKVKDHVQVSFEIDTDKIGGGADSYSFRLKKIPISTGIAEDISPPKSPTLSGSGTRAVTLNSPSTSIAGDQFYITVEGIGTNDDLLSPSINFKVIG